MKTIKMDCGAFYNNIGFCVGRKYLSLYEAGTHRIKGKIELTPSIINELEEIKEKYRYDDAGRTYNVIGIVEREIYDKHVEDYLKYRHLN